METYQVQNDKLLKQFRDRIDKNVVQQEDLKQLRRRCTEGANQQNIIGEAIAAKFYQLFSLMINKALVQRQEKKQSFFLQLLNNLVVNNRQTSKLIYRQLTLLSQQLSISFSKLFTDTQKNRRLLLTFAYNILYQMKDFVSWQQLTNNTNLTSIIYLLLSEIYTQQQQVAFQWRTMIFVILFNWNKEDSESTLSYLMRSNIKHHQLLHNTSIMLQKVIDSKTISTLVKGYSSTIEDITSMYKQNKLALSFSLNKGDVDFLKDKFIEMLKVFKLSFRQLINKVDRKDQLMSSFQQLNDIIELFGNLLFLGGYNNNLQRLFDSIIPFVCEYFRIIYLLFKLSDKEYKQQNLRAYNSQTHQYQIQSLRDLIAEPQTNQANIIEVYESLYTTQMFAITIKFLTNYIHINKEGIKYFEQNLDYLYIILNLTKLSTTQPTMREWSIMFIRNSCETSEEIQAKIGELNVELRTGDV